MAFAQNQSAFDQLSLLPEPVPVVNVRSLTTGFVVATYTLPPDEAVMVCYAQDDRLDYSTWEYETRYRHMVRFGRTTVFCGDYAARLPEPVYGPIPTERFYR